MQNKINNNNLNKPEDGAGLTGFAYVKNLVENVYFLLLCVGAFYFFYSGTMPTSHEILEAPTTNTTIWDLVCRYHLWEVPLGLFLAFITKMLFSI